MKALKAISYSSLLTLHACPRRYQLDKLMTRQEKITSVTFSFGHALGEGIQSVLRGDSWQQTLMDMFTIWESPLLDAEPKKKKSFPNAVLAVEKFKTYFAESDLRNYQLAYFNNKPATELSFSITLPDGYVYRGFIDAVLEHKETGKLLVLEIKSTGFTNLHEAMYKNSAQALGYTLILDALSPNNTMASLSVRYLVYKTGACEFETFNFTKLFNQKLNWIKDTLADSEQIEAYSLDNYFPKRGESCYSFFSPCPHIDYCGLKDSSLQLDLEKESSLNAFDFNFNLIDLVETMETSHV